jgi:hypothetical protein
MTGRIRNVRAPNDISFDSYIQGVVDGKVYLYDRHNERQYEIEPERGNIKEVGNRRRDIRHFENGEWTEITAVKANQTVLFGRTIQDNDFARFDYVFREGNELSGYYYLIDKRNNGYGIFRAPVRSKSSITYLFQVSSLDEVQFFGEYVFIQRGNQISFYSDKTGIRRIIRYSELEFNESLIISVFK